MVGETGSRRLLAEVPREVLEVYGASRRAERLRRRAWVSFAAWLLLAPAALLTAYVGHQAAARAGGTGAGLGGDGIFWALALVGCLKSVRAGRVLFALRKL